MYNGKYKVKYILNKKSKENHSIYYTVSYTHLTLPTT